MNNRGKQVSCVRFLYVIGVKMRVNGRYVETRWIDKRSINNPVSDVKRPVPTHKQVKTGLIGHWCIIVCQLSETILFLLRVMNTTAAPAMSRMPARKDPFPVSPVEGVEFAAAGVGVGVVALS